MGVLWWEGSFGGEGVLEVEAGFFDVLELLTKENDDLAPSKAKITTGWVRVLDGDLPREGITIGERIGFCMGREFGRDGVRVFVVVKRCFLGVVERDLVGFQGATNPIEFLEKVFLRFDGLDDAGEISDHGEEELDFAAVVEDIAQAVNAEVPQDKNKKEQNESRKQKQEPKDGGGGREKMRADRNEGHKHRKKANNEKDAAGIAKAPHQSVVDMSEIRGHDRLSTDKAANNREKDVKQRKGKQEQRSQDHQGSVALLHIATDYDDGEQKAEQHTSCITKKDLGGGEVVVQKADKAAREGKRKEGDEGVSEPQCDQAVAKGGKEAHNRS